MTNVRYYTDNGHGGYGMAMISKISNKNEKSTSVLMW